MDKRKTALAAFIILCIFTSIGLLNITILCFLILPIVAGFYIYSERQKTNSIGKTTFTIPDICFIAVCITEIICYFGSIYKPNSELSTLKILVVGLLYFFVKKYITQQEQTHYLYKYIAYISGVLALSTLLFFFIHKQNYEGMGNLEQYKGFYRPWGMLSNDWATVLLCFMPFPIISYTITKSRLKYLFAVFSCLLTICIIVSFSRGAYISLVAFITVSFVSAFLAGDRKFRRVITKLCVVISVSSIVVTLPFSDAITTTFKMNTTVSQKKSVEGRLAKYNEAISVFKSHPICGVGGGNYTLAIEQSGNEKQGDDFSPRCTNSYLQLLVEKGIIGSCAYLVLTISILKCSYRRIREGDKNSAIFLSGVLAILLREITFSSLFEVDAIFILLIIMCLGICHKTKSDNYELFKK
ncbi:MAG: O-antigen ligase family protein [Bacteroidales bacterium]|nr:O-antigen ligase family protein [Bacteroidales bacterium]